MTMPLILYHADCPDGFGAAYAAWRVYGAGAEYVPCDHGGAVPDVTGRDVYILDFSFDADVMLGMKASARSVTLLDHHQTAHDRLKCLTCGPGFTLLFDMQRSGARMAWAHFHPGQPVPMLISRIEDRDIWRWAYPDSRAYLAALDALPLDFERWAQFQADSEDEGKLALLLASGQAVVDRFNAQVQDLADSAFAVRFLGHDVLAVNAPSEFTSDLGNVLCQKTGTFALVFRVSSPDTVKVGLRAVRGFDVARLAERFGGGGHPQASAFRLPLAQLASMLDGTLAPA
jgi:uncharacterized protein